jgi:hypothetical protein
MAHRRVESVSISVVAIGLLLGAMPAPYSDDDAFRAITTELRDPEPSTMYRWSGASRRVCCLMSGTSRPASSSRSLILQPRSPRSATNSSRSTSCSCTPAPTSAWARQATSLSDAEQHGRQRSRRARRGPLGLARGIAVTARIYGQPVPRGGSANRPRTRSTYRVSVTGTLGHRLLCETPGGAARRLGPKF